MNSKKVLIKVFIVVIFFTVNCFETRILGQSLNILDAIVNELGGPGTIQSDYNSYNKKWVAYLGLPGFPIDDFGTKASIKILIDLADIAGITQEGRDGWVTVWVDLMSSREIIEVEKLFKVSFGVQLRSFDPNTPDSPTSFFDATINANTLLTPIDAFKITSSGDIKLFDLKLGVPSSVSVPLTFSLHGLSFEMRSEILNNLLREGAAPGVTLAEYTKRCINFLSCPSLSNIPKNPFFNCRFSTLDDNPLDTKIQSINGFKLVQAKEGEVIVDVMVKTSDYYYIRVWGDRLFPPGYPKWSWYSKTSMLKYLEANKQYTFHFYVTPDSRTEEFSFWLYQRDSEGDQNLLETYKIIEKINTILYSAPEGTDVQPPLISFVTPGANATVQNSFSTSIQSSDAESGISHVDLFLNGEFVASKFSTPYDFSVNTSGLNNGSFSLTARSYDLAGNGSEAKLSLINSVNVPGTIIISSVQVNKPIFTPLEDITVTVNLANNLSGSTVIYQINNGSSVNLTEIGNGVYQKTFKTPGTTGIHSIAINATKLGFLAANPFITSFQVASAGVNVTSNPSIIQYNGASNSRITATLLNSQGQPISGIPMNFVSSPSGGFNLSSVITNQLGIAEADFIPDNTGLYTIEATAQTSDNPKSTVQVKVNSAGSSTYNITLTTIMDRTNNSIVCELNPYVTYAINGQPVEMTSCNVATNIGTFQNSSQSYSEILGNDGGPGRIYPRPLLTSYENGTVTITITVGPTVGTFSIPLTIGPIPKVQPFFTITDGGSTDDAEREVDWSSDGTLFAYTPGKIVKFPSFEVLYSGPVSNARSLSFSKTGQNIVMGRQSNNSVFYIYNTVSKTVQAFNPSKVITNSVVWSNEYDDYKFALANKYTDYMNQIIIYSGTGLNSSYLYTDGTTDEILALDWKGDYLAAGTVGSSLYLFNTTTLTRLWNTKISKPYIRGLAISHDKSKIAVVSRKYSGYNCLYIYNIGSSTPIYQYSLGTDNGDFYSVDWSPDGSKIVIGGGTSTSTGYIRIIDPTTGTELFDLTSGSTADIWGVSWGPNNVIAAIFGSTVKFFAPFDGDGPIINVKYPNPGFSTIYDTVHIKGKVNDLIGIQSFEYTFNGSSYTPIPILADGSFDHILNINKGQNEIKFKALDRGGQSTEISQSVFGEECFTIIDAETMTLSANSLSTGSFNLTSNISWSVSDDASWLEVNPASGANNSLITVTAKSANTSTEASRSALVTISSDCGLPKTLAVVQGKQVVLPTAITNDALVNSEFDVTLNGSVNTNNSSSIVTFEIGTSLNYGQAIPAIQNPVTGSSLLPVSAKISSIEANKTYHFRIKVNNSAGTVYGDDRTFNYVPSGFDNFEEANFVIYPNPTSGTFTISGIKDYSLVLVDLTGKILLENSNFKDKTVIDLSTYSKGIYILIIKCDNKTFYKRISRI